jgi:AcrR family transcriptional regulator
MNKKSATGASAKEREKAGDIAVLEAPAPKRAGRRPKGASEDGKGGINREAIVARAVEIAKGESETEITIVRLSRELGVTTALIHYFVGSRDDLLTAVFNAALKERTSAFPPLTGDWRHDAEKLIRQSHESQLRWRGMTTYAATHNRHRLFQRVKPGETDYGLVFFDRLGQIFQEGGFTSEQAAMGYHLLMLFSLSVANAHVNRQQPVEHQEWLMDHFSQFDAADYPGASHVMPAFSQVDTKSTFDAGLAVLLDGFESWLAKPRTSPRKKSR